MSALLQSAVKSGGLTHLALPPAFRLTRLYKVLTGGFDASGSTPRVPLPFRPTLQLQALTGGLTHLALPPACHNAAVCKSGRCHLLGHRPPFTVQRYVRPFAPL